MATKEEYAWYKKHRICVGCYKRTAFHNHVLCEMCIEKKKKQSYNYCRPENSKKKNQELKKNLYRMRKEQGLCVRCGKKALKNHVLCLECNIKNNRREKENRDKSKSHIENKCRWCNNQRVEGKTLCSNCLEKARKQAEYARSFVNTDNHIWKKMGTRI